MAPRWFENCVHTDFLFRLSMYANRASSWQSGDRKQMSTMLEGSQSSGGWLDRWGRRFS